MKIEKVKRQVRIVCEDDIVIKDFLHLDEGLRILDLMNMPDRRYLPVTVVEIYYISRPRLLRTNSKLLIQKDVIILNTAAIKWIEEI